MTPKPADRLGLVVRDAGEHDLAAIAALYAHHVQHGFGSFEEVPPDLAEMTRRWRTITAAGLPYLVVRDGTLFGYAYAAPFLDRSAYRFTLEDSVYVAPEAQRRGVGQALLGRLVERCSSLGYRQLVAMVGDSRNAGSIGLHAAHGFMRVGLLSGVGFKLGQTVDCVIMQRALAPAAR